MKTEMKFSDIPIGATFTCSYGMYKKISNAKGKHSNNAIGVHSNGYMSFYGSTICKIVEVEQ